MTYQIFFLYFLHHRFVRSFFFYVLQWEQHKEELRENNWKKKTISWKIMFLCYCSSSRSQYPTIYAFYVLFFQSIYWPTYDLVSAPSPQPTNNTKEKQFSTITYPKLFSSFSCCLPTIFISLSLLF